MNKDNFITFEIIDVGVYSIKLKGFGEIGDIVFLTQHKSWNFISRNNFNYRSIYLAIILNKLNELNEYKKEKK